MYDTLYVIAYVAKSGATRYAFLQDAGNNGYCCAADGGGTYQTRSLGDALRYSISHSPWPTYATKRAALAYAAQEWDVDAAPVPVALFGAPDWAPKAWEVKS